MTRRALLLGCPGTDLVGVEADLATMTALLVRYAFTEVVSLLRGTRAAILIAIRDLIARTDPGDAVVLYYSGHGWRVDLPGGKRDGRPADFQGIAPEDFARSTAADFRGVLADELSALVDELSEKTANVTVILDCCHATGITRGPTTRPYVRAIPVPWTVPAAEFHASLRAQGLLRARRDPETNPQVVRLFACSPFETAAEDRTGAFGGLLTKALAAVLAGCDHGAMVWEDLQRRLEAGIPRASQRPQVVGPARRYLFSLDTRALAGAAACLSHGDVVWVVGGAMTDVRVGDRFAARAPVDLRAADVPGPALAQLEVTEVHHQLARATVTPPRPLPDGTTVSPIAWGSPRAAVTVAVDPARRVAVCAAVAATGQLRVTEADRPTDVPTLATLADSRAGLELRDRTGAVVATDLTLDAACAALERMTRAATLRRLRSVAGLDPETHAFDLEWSCDGRPLAAGDALPARARVSARVHNRGRFPLHVTLFAAEADGHVRLLTRSQPGGVELLANHTYELGDDRLHGVRGVALSGSASPRSGSEVALVAFVLEHAVPLGAWETLDPDAKRRGGAASPTVPDDFPQHPIRYAVTVLDVRIA